MTAYVTDVDQVRWALPRPVAWRLEYTAGVPCDSFWVRCVWDAGNPTRPERWVRFLRNTKENRCLPVWWTSAR